MSDEHVRQSTITKNTVVSLTVVVMVVGAAFATGGVYFQVGALVNSMNELKEEVKEIKTLAGTRVYLDSTGMYDLCKEFLKNN